MDLFQLAVLPLPLVPQACRHRAGSDEAEGEGRYG